MKNITHIVPLLFRASPSHLRSRTWAFLLSAAILPLLFSAASSSFAGSATWSAAPSSGDWNTAGNWVPMTVPNGSADTATFASSNQAAVSLSANAEVNSITFNPGASAFTIAVPKNSNRLVLSGMGIINNSGITQNFSVGGDVRTVAFISFTNGASAGSSTNFTVATDGILSFTNKSSAANGAYTPRRCEFPQWRHRGQWHFHVKVPR
jgi:hypothetical protein